MSEANRQEALEKLSTLIKDIEFAMLTTVDGGGDLRSRPMAVQKVDASGTLWFFTRDAAPKSSEINAEHRVNVAFADPGNNRYVSVSGEASVVRDVKKNEELWNAGLKAWFPNGPRDPEVSLIRVEIQKAEYWDAPNSKMVVLAGMIKAVVTGKPLQKVGDHKKLNLH